MSQFNPDAGPPVDQPPPGGPPPGPPQAPIPPAGYGYQQPGYPQPVYGYPAPGTNGFAIASLICAFLCFPLGLVFGIIARNQVKTSREGGDGLALAGIIISAIFLVLTVLYLVAFFTFFHAVITTNTFNTVP